MRIVHRPIAVIFLTWPNTSTVFELDETGHTRGHSFKLKKRRTNTDLRQHFFSEKIVNIWNALDDDLVCSSSLNVFKNGLHRQWKKTVCWWIFYDLWSCEAEPVPLDRPLPGEYYKEIRQKLLVNSAIRTIKNGSAYPEVSRQHDIVSRPCVLLASDNKPTYDFVDSGRQDLKQFMRPRKHTLEKSRIVFQFCHASHSLISLDHRVVRSLYITVQLHTFRKLHWT